MLTSIAVPHKRNAAPAERNEHEYGPERENGEALVTPGFILVSEPGEWTLFCHTLSHRYTVL